MGWVGQGQHLLWWRILLCKIRNSEAKKERFKNPPAFLPETSLLAGGKKAERGEKRILGASQGRSATARDGVARFFSRKILVTFLSPRKIVCPAESKLVFRIFVKKCSNFVQKTPQQNNEPGMNILGSLFYCGDAGIRSRVTKFFAPSIRKKQSTPDPASAGRKVFKTFLCLRLSNPPRHFLSTK